MARTSETLTECIMLRVTPAEFETITRAANKRQHLIRSGYVRAAVLSCGTNVQEVQSQRAERAELLAAVRHFDRHFYSLDNMIKHSDPASAALLYGSARELLQGLADCHSA